MTSIIQAKFLLRACLYHLKVKNLFKVKVDDTYINTWSTYFRQHARVAPYLSSNTANDLEKAFKFSNVKETSVQAFV